SVVSCLVVMLSKIEVGSGRHPVTLDQNPTNPAKIHEQNARITVARYAATPETSPEPIIAVVPAIEPSDRPWLPRPERTIPKCVAFFDVETTGASDKDRIVTFAGVKLLDTATLSTGSLQMAYIYLIFDPGRKSHPSAEAVHGYSRWALRHQESIAIYRATSER